MARKEPKINGVKQEFDIIAFDNEFKNIKINDRKEKNHDCVVLDRQCKDWDLTKIKRGTRLICIASRGKVKAYGKKVITHILTVLPPIQLDLVEYLQEGNVR